MRRFLRGPREEDCSQIHYLTAKCSRLARDKALSEREVAVWRERERKLQKDFQNVAAQLVHQEKTNMELKRSRDHLLGNIRQQQEVVETLRRRVFLLVEESERDEEVTRQVTSELLCLQSSEVQLQGLLEELHAEAQHRDTAEEGPAAELHGEALCADARTQSLLAELQSKTAVLEDVQQANKMLMQQLKDAGAAHEQQVAALQRQNEGSVKKLQDTVEQFEWLCQQQRYWVDYIKRFKDCLVEERESLVHRVNTLEREAQTWKKSRHGSLQKDPRCPLQDAHSHRAPRSSWDSNEEAELEQQVMRSKVVYETHQDSRPAGGREKSTICISPAAPSIAVQLSAGGRDDPEMI
ncbi:uncharacterized protein LOC133645104 isoform X2 [Entelurus aequoreus]|uniref:uncharacterized protein LOC133645104 isoform X2 n=1 Tax=Entelurus aequoreus TaxID=161455 RepID=UPI002B1D28F5|nr:uncharacterized protein LOC133645104 isoform X2 [Entelurus aequoreus]